MVASSLESSPNDTPWFAFTPVDVFVKWANDALLLFWWICKLRFGVIVPIPSDPPVKKLLPNDVICTYFDPPLQSANAPVSFDPDNPTNSPTTLLLLLSL